MRDDAARQECERLFLACAPFVRAEQDAADAVASAQAALKTARVVFKTAQEAAAIKRRIWVDFLLAHDHRETCLARPPAGAAGEG